MVNFSSFPPFPAYPIDVLRVLELSENMEGVSLEAGLCTSRRGTEATDLAYKIDKKIQLSAPTKQLFPGTVNYCILSLNYTVTVLHILSLIILRNSSQ